MAKSPNQKLKLLYLYQILLQRTDEEHPITVPQLIGELDLRGIRAERKTSTTIWRPCGCSAWTCRAGRAGPRAGSWAGGSLSCRS